MSSHLKIFTDGGSRGNPGPAGIGVHVVNEQGETVFQRAGYLGVNTNNEAEYKAVLASLEWLIPHLSHEAVERVDWYLDSKLVVEQVSRRWKIKELRLQQYAQQIWAQLNSLTIPHAFHHVPREQNKAADALVNQAVDAALAG